MSWQKSKCDFNNEKDKHSKNSFIIQDIPMMLLVYRNIKSLSILATLRAYLHEPFTMQ